MEVFEVYQAVVSNSRSSSTRTGVYTTNIEFENNRSQEVLITLAKDEAGDRLSTSIPWSPG